MVTYFPYWDVSWLVAWSFTLGSVIWIINAFFSWLPLVDPQTEFSNESLTDIARACGFASQSHFTRAFRQATGASPGAWRRARRH